MWIYLFFLFYFDFKLYYEVLSWKNEMAISSRQFVNRLVDRDQGTGHHEALVFTLGLDQLTERADDETLKKLAAGIVTVRV